MITTFGSPGAVAADAAGTARPRLASNSRASTTADRRKWALRLGGGDRAFPASPGSMPDPIAGWSHPVMALLGHPVWYRIDRCSLVRSVRGGPQPVDQLGQR